MFYVHAIFNPKHNKTYIGQASDLVARIEAHQDNIFDNSYTSRFDGECKLIYKEKVATRQEALKREIQLKSFRGREFIKKFIPR